MKLVIIESPYAGNTSDNVAYLRQCLRDSLLRGEAPFASHGLYTQKGILNDDLPAERRHGIEAGFAWWKSADLIAFYTDLGISPGMEAALNRCWDTRKRYVLRTLGDWSHD